MATLYLYRFLTYCLASPLAIQVERNYSHYAVLDRAGYVRVNYNLTDDWSVMWAHDYPFTKVN